MSDVWREWLELAEQDLATARREHGVEEDPNLRAVCFHAQQAAEKLMKALLLQRRTTFPRTHDLVALDRLISATGLDTPLSELELYAITRGAVALRYPGEPVTPEEAGAVLDGVGRLWVALRPLVDSPPEGGADAGDAPDR